MSSLIGFIGRGLWKGGKPLAKGAFGGPVRRMITGGGIGGIYGAATSDSNTATGKFQSMMMGAAGGMAIAGGANLLMSKSFRGAVSNVAIGGIKRRYNQSLVNSYVGGKGTLAAKSSAVMAAIPKWPGRLTKGVGKAGYKIGRRALSFAINHQHLVGTGIILGVGYSALHGGNNQNPIDATLAQQYAEMGAGTDRQRMALQNSTQNLVQGLHQGRHRY